MIKLGTGIAALEAACFVVVAVTVVRTRVGRRVVHAPLAVALVATAGLVVVTEAATRYDTAEVGPSIAFGAVMALAIHQHRHWLVPAPRWWHRTLVGGTVAGAVVALSIDVTANSTTAAAATLWIALAWVSCLLDASVGLWLACRHEAGIIARRVRMLAIASMGLLIDIVLIELTGHDPDNALTLGLHVAGLAMAGVVAVGVAPPPLLRRRWWRSESPMAVNALDALLVRSADEDAVATVTAEWSARLLGGDAAVLVSPDGKMLGHHAASESLADTVAQLVAADTSARIEVVPGVGRLVVAPVPFGRSDGAVAVLSGPLSPAFGADEAEELTHFANTAGHALQHGRQLSVLRGVVNTNRTLLGIVGHDLRNPLTAVAGITDLLRTRRDHIDADTMSELVERLHTNVDRMRSILSDVLDHERAARAELAEVDLNRLIRDVALSVDDGRRVRLHGTEAWGLADPGLTWRAVENLVRNALTHTGGLVDVATETVGDSVYITVSDRGDGIADAEKMSVFAPGRRDGARQGLGLGLFLVRQIADFQGGRVWISDRDGGGSVFTLALPAYDGPALPAVDDADGAHHPDSNEIAPSFLGGDYPTTVVGPVTAATTVGNIVRRRPSS